MSPEARSAWPGWMLLGLILLGAILFGAVSDLPLPGSGARYNIRHLFVAAVLTLSGLALLVSARSRRPHRLWLMAGLAYPAWVALQLVPLPRFLLALLSPERLRLHDHLAARPLAGCEGVVEHAQGAWLTISADPLASFERLGYLLAALLVFFAARAFSEGEERRSLLLAFVAVFAALESFYGIAQWTSDTPMILWRVKTAYTDVATGTLVNRNHFAQLLYLGLGAALALTLRVRSRPDEAPGRAMALRITIGLLMGAHLAGIAASQSRAGLGIALLVLAASALTFSLRRGGTRRLELILALVLLVPVVLLAGPALLQRIVQLPAEWLGEGSRGAVLRASLNYFADYPLVGSGAATFAMIFGIYRTPGVEGAYTYAHNDFLETLLETGAPGLVLALIPLALFVRGLQKEAPWRDVVAGSRAPMQSALLGVVLHALVDFGLQIPSNLFLFAFLAGAFGPRSIMAGKTEGVRRRPALAALAMVPLLALSAALVPMSLARWPGWENRLPWPHLSEIDNRQAVDIFAKARRHEDPAEARKMACRALDLQISAARATPANAFFWVGYATRGAALTTLGHVEGDALPAIRRSVSSAVETGRELDPWNGRSRERLMRVALASGDLAGAIEDARAVARVDKLSRRLVENLLEIGIPPQAVADIVEGERAGYVALLSELLAEERFETLRVLVPADVEPTSLRCRTGWVVASVLRRAHELSGESFLRTCLEDAALEIDETQRGRLVAELVRDYRVAGRLDEAEELLPEIADRDRRAHETFEIAFRRGDWPAASAAALAYLDTRLAKQQKAAVRARSFRMLAEAQAQQGQLSAATKSLERALYFEPRNERMKGWIRDMERGINPFSER